MHTWKGFHLASPQLPKSAVPRQSQLFLNWAFALWCVAGGRAKGPAFQFGP